jgi:hypothetical protein
MAPDERARAHRALMPLVMGAGRWLGELNLRHFRTGEIIPFLVDWFRIDDHAHRAVPMNMATVSRDLRGQKQLEEESSTPQRIAGAAGGRSGRRNWRKRSND